MSKSESTAITVFGFGVAVTAVIGSQVLGWEWGDGELLPTLLGVTVAGIAILLVFRQYSENGIGAITDRRG